MTGGTGTVRLVRDINSHLLKMTKFQLPKKKSRTWLVEKYTFSHLLNAGGKYCKKQLCRFTRSLFWILANIKIADNYFSDFSEYFELIGYMVTFPLFCLVKAYFMAIKNDDKYQKSKKNLDIIRLYAGMLALSPLICCLSLIWAPFEIFNRILWFLKPKWKTKLRKFAYNLRTDISLPLFCNLRKRSERNFLDVQRKNGKLE